MYKENRKIRKKWKKNLAQAKDANDFGKKKSAVTIENKKTLKIK